MSGSPFYKKKSRIEKQMIVIISRVGFTSPKVTDDESPPRYFIKSFSENLPTNYTYILYMYNYLSIYGVKL